MTRTRGVVTAMVLALALGVGLVPFVGPAAEAAQGAACRQVLARASVRSGTYAQLDAAPFGGRVYVYVPEGTRPSGVWVVEGVYGRPFVRPSGSLSSAEFAKLQRNRNIRATAIRISDGTPAQAVIRVGRNGYPVQVVGVSGSTVRVQVCAN